MYYTIEMHRNFIEVFDTNSKVFAESKYQTEKDETEFEEKMGEIFGTILMISQCISYDDRDYFKTQICQYARTN